VTSTTSSTAPAIVLDRVSRLFGSFAALREVSLSLPAGASVVLLGENGAGKSTLLKLVAGLATPTYGTVSVFGGRPLEQRHRVATMSHATMLYDELTALENLRYFAGLHADTAARALSPEQALRDVGLDPALPRRVGDYSQGMRQRASLARVLLTEPDLLLLDEPFSNLDAGSAHSMVERLRAYLATPSADGIRRTLLLTTHQPELARPLASLVLTLREGRIVDREEIQPATHDS
jgi:ABC-type multidrug transport system ATPase subunit